MHHKLKLRAYQIMVIPGLAIIGFPVALLCRMSIELFEAMVWVADRAINVEARLERRARLLG